MVGRRLRPLSSGTACLFWTKKVSAPCSILPGKQREKILFRHEHLPEHLNVEDVAAGDKLVREYETTFINGGLRLKPLKTNNGVYIHSEPVPFAAGRRYRHGAILRADHAAGRFVHRRKGGVPAAAVIMPYAISKKIRRRTGRNCPINAATS